MLTRLASSLLQHSWLRLFDIILRGPRLLVIWRWPGRVLVSHLVVCVSLLRPRTPRSFPSSLTSRIFVFPLPGPPGLGEAARALIPAERHWLVPPDPHPLVCGEGRRSPRWRASGPWTVAGAAGPVLGPCLVHPTAKPGPSTHNNHSRLHTFFLLCLSLPFCSLRCCPALTGLLLSPSQIINLIPGPARP